MTFASQPQSQQNEVQELQNCEKTRFILLLTCALAFFLSSIALRTSEYDFVRTDYLRFRNSNDNGRRLGMLEDFFSDPATVTLKSVRFIRGEDCTE